MLGTLGLHVIQFPSGRWGFVGSVPTELCTTIPATTAAVMGGRAFRDAEGNIVEWKAPVFDSSVEAVTFAHRKGYEARATN